MSVVQRFWVGLGLAAILLTGILFASMPVRAQEESVLSYGQEVEGNLQSRAGDEWSFRGCAGDTISVTVQSNVFSPYVELYPPTGRRSLAEMGDEGDGALIDGVKLPESGEYIILTTGEQRSDRGPYTLALVAAATADESALADADGTVAYGDERESEITNRFGEEWGFYGCAGDIVSVEMTSGDFTPYLELHNADGIEPLTESPGNAARRAQITRFTLPASGPYFIIAGGADRGDRGPYSVRLTLHGNVNDATPTATATRTRRPTATRTATPRLTSTPRPTNTPRRTSTPTSPPVAQCTVLVNGLNLRAGPGTNYAPPIGAIPLNDTVRMLARNQSSTWIQVQVVGTGQIGWVSAAAQYVRCTSPAASLPLGAIPPTYTPVPTPTYTPTTVAVQPTPTLAGVVIGVPSGPKGSLRGDVYTDPSMVVRYGSNGPVFRDRLLFYIVAYDPDDRGSPRNGAGIKEMRIRVFRNGDLVNDEGETSVPFCAFDDESGRCRVIDLRSRTSWPTTGKPIEDGVHTASFQVESDRGDVGTWEFDFEIERDGGQPSGNLVLELAQTGPGTDATTVSGAFVFQVRAYNTGVGNFDGAHIDRVDLRIIDPEGTKVHERTERNAAYCIFAGGEPDCNVWRFGEHGNRWPNDKVVLPGTYRLQATATDRDGRQASNEWFVTIQQ